ncbi:hypothetical protein B296_00030724 [Ensete ventricosum]|uniref:Uncharacterized protein n=1 Tax=Ensete ventricosum TaxID=4639 RepID=A0A426X4Q1_ENSVE|nr:hypothetical protein B296_00030724 [Ensete ventricosum]
MQRINRLWKQLSRSVGGRVIAESVTVACAEAQRKPWTWGRECVGVVPVSVDAWSKRTQGFRFLHNVEENNVAKMVQQVFESMWQRTHCIVVDISRSRVSAELNTAIPTTSLCYLIVG